MAARHAVSTVYEAAQSIREGGRRVGKKEKDGKCKKGMRRENRGRDFTY